VNPYHAAPLMSEAKAGGAPRQDSTFELVAPIRLAREMELPDA